MLRSVVFATSHLQPLPDLARRAEALGYHRAWTTEYTDRDALIRCLLIGTATTTLEIGTGIAYSFPRHPVTLAAAAADIHEATGGRFSLGLGAATRGMRHRWFGVTEKQPVAQMREVTEALRVLWDSAGAASYHGRFFDIEIADVDHAARLAGLPPIGIFGSGLNDSMLTNAADWCDGILLHPLTLAARGQRRIAGLLPPNGSAPPMSQWAVTSISADREAARASARRALAFYLSTPSYAGQFADTPWETVPAALIAEFKRSGADWHALSQIVPDAMLDDYCIAGTPAEAPELAAKFEQTLAETGVSELVLQVAVTGLGPDDTSRAITEALTALGPR